MPIRSRLARLILIAALAACATPGDPPPVGREGQQETAAGFRPETELFLCPRMSVSNAPPVDAERRVRGYKPFARVNGVSLLVNPAPGACLSSSYGSRDGRLHKGLDYQSDPPGPVLAAGAGKVLESGYRDDYGRYVLIDHGSGVYTRYAHFSDIRSAAIVGAKVGLGTELGTMGNTASYRIPIHLHYEVLIGDYDTPKKSFGLKPVNILAKM